MFFFLPSERAVVDANRIAGLPFQARWVLGPNGERSSYRHAGSRSSATSDPARPTNTGS